MLRVLSSTLIRNITSSSRPSLSGLGTSNFREHTVHNNDLTSFDFTEENYKEVEKIINKYPKTAQGRRSAIMPLLTLAQKQNSNWLPFAAMKKVAQIVDVYEGEVAAVATFYSMYNREPVGKYFVQMCTTTPCMLCNGYEVLEAMKKYTGLDSHGHEHTTKDGLFTLIEVECLGACVNAPMMQINDDYYEDLTPETAVAVLRNLKEGKPVKPGPQNGRFTCEGPKGQTSLLSEPSGPYIRKLVPLPPPPPPPPPPAAAASTTTPPSSTTPKK